MSKLKWTLEKCKEDALKYKSKAEWKKNSPSAYRSSLKNKWLKECSTHMARPVVHNKKWTLEACKADALKYKNKVEWQKNSRGYSAAHKKGWLDQCCKYMERPIVHNKKWTLEACKLDASKYKTKTQWRKFSLLGYSAAHKNNWLDQCCGHMDVLWQKKWTLEACKADALKYKSKSEWGKNSSGAYDAAKTNGWLDKCCKHMDVLWEKKWSLETCKADALKYKSRSEWAKKNPGAYDAALRKNWLDQCCKHMEILGGTSIPEQELQKAIKENIQNLSILTNKKFTILPEQKLKLNLTHAFKYELDIYIPDLNLGIEFNGTYYHSFKGLKRGRPNWTDEQIKSYHKDKTKFFNSLGIKVINIEEAEWKKDPATIINSILTQDRI